MRWRLVRVDYKKLIPNQELRLKILGLTDFIPDKAMIKLQYRIKTGRKLNLKNPERFTEKLQWYKLYYRDSLMTKCADKYDVRDYIATKGYRDILIPLYGVYESSEGIDFSQLPERFVLKTTNGSHTNIFCDNKANFNIKAACKTLNKWLSKRTTKAGREWAYYEIKPRIVCEKYLEKDKNNDLIDYKFYCFSGKISYIKVVKDRFHITGQRQGLFNSNFEQLPYYKNDVLRITEYLEKPKNYDMMCKIAEDLSSDFPHVRVDLYNINGRIYFGELTFYDTSGYETFDPDMFDFLLGKEFELPVSE